MIRKNRSKIMSVLSVALLFSLILISCKPTSVEKQTTTDVTSDPVKEKLKVAYMPCGQITDGGMAQYGWEAIQSVEDEYNLEIALTESSPVADAARIAGDYADQGYDVVFLHCGSFSDAALEAAKYHPDTWFGAPNPGDVPLPNIFRYDGNAQEGAFLAGALAGLTTKTNTLGIIAGFTFPGLTRQVEGFRLGARYVNPNVEVLDIYINSWDDIALGKEAALSMIDSGADILYVATDSAGEGVFKAAEERGVYAIGNIGDLYPSSPTTVLTSNVHDWGVLLIDAIRLASEGKLEAKMYESQKAPWGHLAPYREMDSVIPQAAKDTVVELTTKMNTGEIVLPSTAEIGVPDAGKTIDPESVNK